MDSDEHDVSAFRRSTGPEKGGPRAVALGIWVVSLGCFALIAVVAAIEPVRLWLTGQNGTQRTAARAVADHPPGDPILDPFRPGPLAVAFGRVCWLDGSVANCWRRSEKPTMHGSGWQGLVAVGFDVAGIDAAGRARHLDTGEPLDDVPTSRDGATTCRLRGSRVTCEGSDAVRTAAPVGDFVDLQSDSDRYCALRTDGMPICWGRRPELDPTTLAPVADLAVTRDAVCGLDPVDGHVRCLLKAWNAPPTQLQHSPTGGGRFVAVASDGRRVYALDSEGQLYQGGELQPVRPVTPPPPRATQDRQCICDARALECAADPRSHNCRVLGEYCDEVSQWRHETPGDREALARRRQRMMIEVVSKLGNRPASCP